MMNKTKIEWVKNPDGTQGYTINPIKGLCPVGCSYCYARRLYKRFKWNPEIRFVEDAMDICLDMKQGSRVFVGSTMELFGDWVKEEWLNYIFKMVMANQQHTFIFLTKQPQNLPKWSPFPENCWIGVTATDNNMAFDAGCNLASVNAKVKFISFEPLLGRMAKPILDLLTDKRGINWLIIGQQTPISAKTQPKIEWIQEIELAAKKAAVPIFEKNNLYPLLQKDLVQEYPIRRLGDAQV